MRKSHTRVVPAAVAFAIAGLGLTAAPAAAADEPPAEARHCVATATAEPELRCFPTFADALRHASGGRLTTGPKNAADAVNDPAFNAAVDAANAQADLAARARMAASTVLSIDYVDDNYGGNDLIWTGDSGNCSTSTNNTDYEADTMPSGWNNVVTSYRTYANCWVRHWETPFQNGAVVGYHGSRTHIGAAMDERTSSEQWS